MGTGRQGVSVFTAVIFSPLFASVKETLFQQHSEESSMCVGFGNLYCIYDDGGDASYESWC